MIAVLIGEGLQIVQALEHDGILERVALVHLTEQVAHGGLGNLARLRAASIEGTISSRS